MIVLAGTSGYSFKEWKGAFYPVDLPDSKMLEFYATRLPAVEINNTFYRMPKPAIVRGWRERSPGAFRFALKAPQRITHRERLAGSKESVDFFFSAAGALGGKLGPVLFQLPPFFKKDLPRLAEFLTLLPASAHAAFEFRHPSWFADDVYAQLHAKNAALVGGDVDEEGKSPPFVATANWGYLRLRKSEYAPGELEHWVQRILGQSWTRAYVYMKHEVKGPELAAAINALANSGSGATDPEL
jgi:uncharacterized protein YecE (DUF72 family)